MNISTSDPTRWVLTARDCLFEGVRVGAAVGRSHSIAICAALGRVNGRRAVLTSDSDKSSAGTGWWLGGITDPFTRLVYTFGDLHKHA
jgi:hypothetical protein